MLLFKYDWVLSQGALTWLLILGGLALLYVFNMVVARRKKSTAGAGAEKPSGDDLTQLAGINAAIQQALQAAGITTFARLAEADLAKLRQILQEAGLPVGDWKPGWSRPAWLPVVTGRRWRNGRNVTPQEKGLPSRCLRNYEPLSHCDAR